MTSVVSLDDYRPHRNAAFYRTSSESEVIDDIADRVVHRLNQRASGFAWTYRSPVQARDIPRNRWAAITTVEEAGDILPNQQLYLRMNDRRLEAGFMCTTQTPDQAISRLQCNWALSRGLRDAETSSVSFSVVMFGRVAPIFGQIQDPCDLKRWVTAAGRFKCGQADSVAAFAFSNPATEPTELEAEATALLFRLSYLYDA